MNLDDEPGIKEKMKKKQQQNKKEKWEPFAI